MGVHPDRSPERECSGDSCRVRSRAKWYCCAFFAAEAAPLWAGHVAAWHGNRVSHRDAYILGIKRIASTIRGNVFLLYGGGGFFWKTEVRSIFWGYFLGLEKTSD